MRRTAQRLTGLVAMLALAAAPAIGQIEKRPGAGQSLEAPHPSFKLEQVRPEGFQPKVGAMQFLPNGMLAVTSFTPQNNGVFREQYNGTLYVIENPTEKDPAKIKITTITEDLHDPLGMNFVDGALYICDRNEVTKWTDTNDDGIPDERETFSSGWISDNYHHFTFGLPYDGENFYITLSTNITFKKMIVEENIVGKIESLNGPNPELRGTLLKIDGETGEFEPVVGGLRTPNGVSLGPDNQIIIPDNQGAWKPSSMIYVAEPGAFYGHYNNTEATSDFYPDGGVPSLYSEKPITPPAIWIPQNECANSPGNMVEIPEGQPYAGQYFMAEITKGGMRRVFFEEVDGTWQGAIFRHSHGFDSGLNRLTWGPDGNLYVGGMGASGNWSWKGKQFALHRMVPTGETAFEFEKVEVTKDGFRVTFTKPVDKAQLEDTEAWYVNAWTYKQTARYGGPKIPKDKKEQVVPVDKAVASDDGMSVELILADDRQPNHVYHIRTDATSKDGDTMWTTEAWYTFHKAPAK